jgi:DNA-directed RNA polymerase subunit F
MSEKDAKKIIKFLIEKYEIEEVYAINIVNLDPKSIFELRTILEKSFTGKILNDEQLRNLLSEIEELKS